MPKLKDQRICQIGAYWLSKKPGRDGNADAWCRTWYDSRARQTKRVSLGTGDLSAAGQALAAWVVIHGERRQADPAGVTMDEVLLRYWELHAKELPSAATARKDIACWQEFFEGRAVAEITPAEQRRFREWLQTRSGAKGLSRSGMDRILSTGRAALNRAVREQELTAAPFIFMQETAEEKRGRDPKGRPVTPEEIARLFDAARSGHVLMYLLLAVTTLARPEAILDLTADQIDLEHGTIDLNPPGRRQTNKHRPVLPIAPTLRPWLVKTAGPTGHFVTYRRKAIASISVAWRELRETAGLDDRVSAYSVRHGMAREMRRRRVPTEQISAFLGHLPRGSAATTAIYAPYDPDYLADAITAIEDTLTLVRGHLKRISIDRQMVAALEPLVPIDMTGKASRRGVGDAKRQEVRRLILDGVPHAEIVRRAGVSSGTVSGVRKAMKDDGLTLLLPAARGACVPLACREPEGWDDEAAESGGKIGGPGRTRTCNQTVMSGRL